MRFEWHAAWDAQAALAQQVLPHARDNVRMKYPHSLAVTLDHFSLDEPGDLRGQAAEIWMTPCHHRSIFLFLGVWELRGILQNRPPFKFCKTEPPP